MKNQYTAEEMREMALVEESYGWDVVAKMLRQAADMMDMADRVIADRDNWRRQALDEDAMANAATIKDSLTVGNAAAIREALEELVGAIDKYDSKNPLWWNIGAKGVKPLKDARAALAAPPINCDVGKECEQ